jgi:tetratricopeptide (TPR) repeat protein
MRFVLTRATRMIDYTPHRNSRKISQGITAVFALKRQYDLAIEQYEKAIELQPNFAIAYGWLAHAYVEKRMFGEAIAAAKTAVNLSDRNPLFLGMLGHALAASGKRDEALEILEELNVSEKTALAPPYQVALIFANLGEKDKAFEWLERAMEEHSVQVMFLKVDPACDPFRSDPRFQNLLRRMNFPE